MKLRRGPKSLVPVLMALGSLLVNLVCLMPMCAHAVWWHAQGEEGVAFWTGKGPVPARELNRSLVSLWLLRISFVGLTWFMPLTPVPRSYWCSQCILQFRGMFQAWSLSSSPGILSELELHYTNLWKLIWSQTGRGAGAVARPGLVFCLSNCEHREL
jgi:hypothetical protein